MPPSTEGGTPAATFSAGRPYFVMELVRGIRITDYCDQANLSTKERLDLFIRFAKPFSTRTKRASSTAIQALQHPRHAH